MLKCSIIVVNKKDVGWSFCADYRALNKINIPDEFSITIVDELGWATNFSKLGLKFGYQQIRMKGRHSQNSF